MNPINTHIHLFNKEDLPKNLFCGLIRLLAGRHKVLDCVTANLRLYVFLQAIELNHKKDFWANLLY